MIQLKQFQRKAIDKLVESFYYLWQKNKKGAELVFKAPTGSGKTIMMAEFLRKITDSSIYDTDKAFI